LVHKNGGLVNCAQCSAAARRFVVSEPLLRLFVSSPGDVPDERRRVDLVVERLNAAFKGRVQIKTIRWETSYYSAHETFQKQIPEAADCDVVVGIFRARLGTPLPPQFPTLPSGAPYPSGAAYEVLSAIEARQSGKDLPDVYVFRYAGAPLVALDAADRAAIEQQWRGLQAFFTTWFQNTSGEFLAAFQDYSSTDDFAQKVEDCLRQWLARQGYTAQGTVWDRVLRGSPFPGLAAFEAGRAAVFFGRDTALARAIARLREASAPFLLLIGASGSGKSSLLRAGLLPRLTAPGTIPEVDLWRTALVVPGRDPFLSLAESLFADEALGPELRRGIFATREMLAAQLATGPATALAPLRDALERAARPHGTSTTARLALAVDQAERLFLETGLDKAEAFARLLAALVASRLATVVVVLRSDAYAPFQRVEALVNLRDSGATFDLLPPSAAEMEDMVTRPAAACSPALGFEQRDGTSLATVLVADAKGGDALPLLQMTLSRLYAAEAGRGDGVLRFADYRGMNEAVTATANEVLATLAPGARDELPALVTGLVHDVVADPLTRAPLPVVTALDRSVFEAQNPARKTLIDAFVESRLLTAGGDGAAQTVRPVHEALLRIWPQAQAIIAETASLIRVRLTLEPMVRAWLDAPEDTRAGYLELSPALLDGAQQLLGRFGTDVPPAMRDFVAAAAARDAAKRDQERQEQERRLRDAQALAAANRRTAQRTGAGLVVALVLAGAAGWQWHTAEVERQAAQRSLALATNTANGLVFDLAQKFRFVAGVPATMIKDILNQARTLQDQLILSGQTSPALLRSQAAALDEYAKTLLTLGDTKSALAAARQAQGVDQALLAAQPDNTLWQDDLGVDDTMIGNALNDQGDTSGALAAYRAAQGIDTSLLQSGANTVWQQHLAADDRDLGEVIDARNDLAGALTAYRAAQGIDQALVAQDSTNTDWQSALASDDNAIGAALQAQGDMTGALAAYNASKTIDQALAAQDSTNTLWQFDLGSDDSNIGDLLSAQHDLPGALTAFRAAQTIDTALAAQDKTNRQFQGVLAITDGDLGSVLWNQGDLPGALAAFRAAKAIDQTLAAQDPTNTMWPSDIGDSDRHIGYVLQTQGDLAGALAAYREALGFDQTLAAQDKTDAAWQEDLGDDEVDAGMVLLAQKNLTGALTAYRAGQAIAKTLAAQDPANLPYQALLAAYDGDVGGVLMQQHDLPGALAAFREARTITAALGTNSQWQSYLATDDRDIGVILAYQGDFAGALEALHEAQGIDQALATKAPTDARWQKNLTFDTSLITSVMQAKK
jgi:tetratricopeptide (TPR) repeat protein